jgi:HEAT repeat protein
MLDSAIRQLSLHPDADARPLVDLPGLQQADVETILLRRLSRATDAEQVAILRLLAIRGTQRSVPTLLRLARHDEIREKALSTLRQIVGVGGLPQVVQSTTDPPLRADLMRRLLDAESEPALLGFLSLVRGEATRSEALAVAEAAPNLPIDELFALLDHPEQPLRFSAALVLGHVDGPAVTRRLIARVTEQPANSREAWMALLACRGELADEFFTYATRRPQLLGYVNNARLQWAGIIP